MSASDRQSRLLVTEDWKRIYQSFRNADFQSYDFDNLRRTMINYLRQNYPEDFNDYIESSEYLALIDMIAFLGQNLSFRIDLNARENFLETAERRESILRLARMLSYNPKRNQAANGILKIETIKTDEVIFDSAGRSLAGVVIKWNDQTNRNYLEQFIRVLNAALPVSNQIGSPLKSENIDGVQTQKYRLNATNIGSAVFPFSKQIEGVSSRFEVVSTDIQGDKILEEPPIPGTSPAFLFRDDGQGAGSNNTGFFMHFRQGRLDNGTFSISSPTPNQIVNIDAENINDTDVWLYNVDSNGIETTPWTKLDSIEGSNIIYNSLFEGVRNVYNVATRVGDRINLVFSDGVFGNLPSGNFKIYYRTSQNANMVITPGAMGQTTISIPYQTKTGQIANLTLGLRLKYTVSNSSPSETNRSIRQNAPATYYTQNRLITGEDYNLGPLSISQDVVKTKSVNRISSGISKYFDLKDVTGKYSNTSLFADDGVIYKDYYETRTDFSFSNQRDIEGIIYNIIEPILGSSTVKNFYFSEFPIISVTDLNATWNRTTVSTNRSSGTLKDIDGSNYSLGTFTTNSLRLVKSETLLKFLPPEGNYFLEDGTLTTDSTQFGAREYKWVKVVGVTGDGTGEVDENNVSPILINDNIPTGSRLVQVLPKFSKSLINDLKVQLIDQMFAYRDFALRYDPESSQWKLITANNINTINAFSTGKSGDNTNQALDSSWILYFKTDGQKYTITHRNLRYVFESANEIRFFFDSSDKIYDAKTGQIVRDKIDILSINRRLDNNEPFTRNFTWNISDAYRDSEGYTDTRKIQIRFFDLDDDGVYDDPELFTTLVRPKENSNTKIIFQKRYVTSDGVEDFKYYDNSDGTVIVVQNESEITPANPGWVEGQLFYLVDEAVFKNLNISRNNTTINTNWKAFVGRDKLKFHYVHVADSSYRIDPSASNIIDTYILSKNYDTEIRKWITGARQTKPLPPSSDQIFREYGDKINSIKSISDEVVYHPVKYKILFGSKAAEDLQVKFKIVRNKNLVINDNELKADIISAIEQFFAIENWDFGETFYFQELSAYIQNKMSPKLQSVVIVPRKGTQAFGSLFEIKSESDEIFVSGATVADIEIIDEITATELQASGDVITSVTTAVTSGISSSAASSSYSSSSSTTTNTTTSTSNNTSSGGYSY
jgi:hypothetical protein